MPGKRNISRVPCSTPTFAVTLARQRLLQYSIFRMEPRFHGLHERFNKYGIATSVLRRYICRVLDTMRSHNEEKRLGRREVIRATGAINIASLVVPVTATEGTTSTTSEKLGGCIVY